jgi:hypothetical protein
MSERAYSRLANALMLIGIGSALLFDSGKLPRAVVGTIGIVAGVAAIALYFWNQLAIKEKQKSAAALEAEKLARSVGVLPAMKTRTLLREAIRPLEEQVYLVPDNHDIELEDHDLPSAARAYRKYLLGHDADFMALQAYRKETAKRFLANYAANHARTLQWHMVKNVQLALMKPEVELSPVEVAECATAIMRNLALIEGVEAWDYTLGPKGLHVSLKRAKSTRPVVSQEDFDFGYIDEAIPA